MKFEVVFADTEEVLNGLSFDNAKEAQAFAKAEQKHYTRKLKIRKIVEDVNWREREATRLKDGTYKPLPDWWLNANWWKGSVAERDHYAHVSKDGENIAYTQSEEKGKLDSQNKLSPSRYLSRYFNMPSHKIRDIAASFKRELYTLHFSDKPEDFERVYEGQNVSFEGSEGMSCMAYSRNHWHSKCPHHPAYIYGAGDLQIAWLQYKDKTDFTVAARCIVYPAKNTFSRVYADNMESFGVLKCLLQERGLEEVHNLEGARLLKIAVGADDRLYLCSYIDGDAISLVDDGKYFRIVSENSPEEHFESGTGTIRIPTFVTCSCGNKMREENVRYAFNAQGQEVRVCSNCLESNYFQCGITGVWYHNDTPKVPVIVINYFGSISRTFTLESVASHYAVFCEGYNSYVSNGRLVTYVGEHGVQKKVSLHWLNHTCAAACLPDKNDGFYYDPRYHDVVGVNGYVSKLRGEPNKKPKVDQPAKDETYKGLYHGQLKPTDVLDIRPRMSTLLPQSIASYYTSPTELFYDESLNYTSPTEPLLFYDESLDEVVTRRR